MRIQIERLAEQVAGISAESNKLLRENKQLTDRIRTAKQDLQQGSSRLLERQLQDDLQASRELSDQIQALDDRIYALTEESVAKQRLLVGMLNDEIERLSGEARAAKDAKAKTRILAEVLKLQEEAETYREQMARESSELLLSLDVAPAQTDGPDEIQQKLAVLQDQQDIIRNKIEELDRQIRETSKALDLRRNMLELLRDIRRGEEDEFDLDRSLDIAELEGEIADAESALEIWRAERESWYAKEKIHGEKAVHLAQELENMLQGK
ncbi:MAG: hypothetical protein F4049_08230 [Gemmatimonadetes bacterium]|nr:hypothetical protein [Gemmatimonadota bacterium]